MAEEYKTAQFNRSLGGYSVEDVDNYVDYINGEYMKLEQRCKDSDRKLLFALRKLESLTLELQNNYTLAGNVPQESAPTREVRESAADVRTEIDEARKAAAAIKEKAEAKAVELIRAATAKADSIVKEAESSKTLAETRLKLANEKAEKVVSNAKLQADAIIAGSAKKARAAAETILKEAAENSRKITRDAEIKANNACRDVLSIYKAAEDMYNEVSSFRGSLFSLYSDHIDSIETITGSAHGLVDSVDGIVRDLEEKDRSVPAHAFASVTSKGAAAKTEEKAEEAPAENAAETVEAAETIEETVEEIAAETEAPAEELHIEEEAKELPEAESVEEFEQLSIEAEMESDDGEKQDEPDETAESEETEVPASLERLSVKDAAADLFDLLDKADANSSRDGEMTDEPLDEPLADPIAETEPDTADEEPEGSEDFAETEPAEDSAVPEEKKKVTEADDFELPDDVSGGTNVLDIVKNLTAGKEKPTESEDFFDLDQVLTERMSVSTDEFNRAFSSSAARDSINQIRNQPTVHPSMPMKHKKHNKF